MTAPISRVRSSVVCAHQGRLLCVRLFDSVAQKEMVCLPGGKIEEDETAIEAAERETFEETGFRVSVNPAGALDREYLFPWQGEVFDCLTIFYRGQLASPLQHSVQDADYNRGVVWIPLEEISKHFHYNDVIRDAVLALVAYVSP